MADFIVRYWLPFLIISLIVALFFEFGAVERFDLSSSDGNPLVATSRPLQPPPRQSLNRDPKPAYPVTKSRLQAGEPYTSLDELVKDQLAVGFVRTGYFGKYWPATVAEIATDKNGISFVRKNGTRHNYTNFPGYEMKMVRLRAGDKETIVVFRSQQKR